MSGGSRRTSRIVLGLVLLTASGLSAQTGGWRPDERVLITDFGIVTALARSPGSVYGATTGGLIILDESFQRLELPITVEDGYPPVAPSAMVFDHRDRSLWLAAGGDLLQFDPFSRRFRERISVRQVVTDLVPAESSGSDLFVRMRGEWWRLDTFSRDLRRADPGAVLASINARPDLRARQEALRDPFFLQSAQQAARTSYAGPVRVLDVIPSRDAYGWWLGTAGESLVRYDEIGRTGSRSALGPAGIGMAAIVATDNSIWFAPAEPLDRRYAVAASTTDLQQWRAWRADSSRAVPDLVNDMLGSPGGIWAGGESGLYWMGDGRTEWREERAVDLSYQPVLSLAAATAPAAEAVWVGSARGLLRVRAAGGGIDIAVMPSVAVGAVVEAEDHVFVGTLHGLYSMLVPDSIGQLVQPRRVQGPAALQSPVGALAASGDTVYAGLDREVWWRAGGSLPGPGWSRSGKRGLPFRRWRSGAGSCGSAPPLNSRWSRCPVASSAGTRSGQTSLPDLEERRRSGTSPSCRARRRGSPRRPGPSVSR